MRGQQGKKAKYVVYAEKGLLESSKWQHVLRSCPTELACRIRGELAKNIPQLNEKFNRRSRYFGYWTGDDKDRLYIYIQKKCLRIDLCINRKNEKDVRRAGFKVVFVNNFQGRNSWLTGWYVPHDTRKMNIVIKWLLKAFGENYNRRTPTGQ